MQRLLIVSWWLLLFAVMLGLVLCSGAVRANTPVFLNMWGQSGSGDGQFAYPRGIAVDSSGRVSVVDSFNNRVQQFDSQGYYLNQWGSWGNATGQFNTPESIAVADQGNIYVADTSNARIQKFDASGYYMASFGGGSLVSPEGLDVDSYGNIFVTDSGTGYFSWYDPTHTLMLQLYVGLPTDVAVRDDVRVYVVERNSTTVREYDYSGTLWNSWGTVGSGDGQFNQPLGVAVSSNGLVYVADAGNHRIQRFGSDGVFQAKWGSLGTAVGNFYAPWDIAVTRTGMVYVTDQGNHRIQRFFDYAAWVDPASHYLPGSLEFDTEFSLDAGKYLIVPDTTTVNNTWLRLTGGSLNTTTINLIGGGLYYESGTLAFQNLNAGLLYVSDGSPLTISQAMSARPDDLVVESYGTLLVDGGEVAASGSVNIWAGAVVAVTSGRFEAGNYITLDGELTLADSLVAHVSTPNITITNNGKLLGSGRVDAAFVNQGSIRASAGERLQIGLNGSGTPTNAGVIEAIGNLQDGGPAEIEFTDPLTNVNSTGLITARNATLRFNRGLTNQGSLAFSFGTSDVFGDIVSTGNISLAGGAEVTFYDDIDGIGGTMVIAKVGSTTSKAVMFGSWNAGFSGGGELFALGDLRPGASPAAVTMGGDLFLGPSTNTYIELGGLTAGSLFDVVNVTGDAALDGDLIVSLIDPLGGGNIFAPSAGDAFEILSAGELLGTFASESFPAIPGKPGLEWLIDYDTAADRVLLSVAPIFEADFDEDGDVDGNDLGVWNLGYGTGTLHTQGDANGDGRVNGGDYLVWQRQFGSSVPLTAANTAVPEPASATLLLCTLAVLNLRFRSLIFDCEV